MFVVAAVGVVLALVLVGVCVRERLEVTQAIVRGDVAGVAQMQKLDQDDHGKTALMRAAARSGIGGHLSGEERVRT